MKKMENNSLRAVNAGYVLFLPQVGGFTFTLNEKDNAVFPVFCEASVSVNVFTYRRKGEEGGETFPLHSLYGKFICKVGKGEGKGVSWTWDTSDVWKLFFDWVA